MSEKLETSIIYLVKIILNVELSMNTEIIYFVRLGLRKLNFLNKFNTTISSAEVHYSSFKTFPGIF